MELTPPNSKAKPVHEVRIGSVKAAIWKNDSEKGIRYNATFERLFKEGDQWKSSSSFSRDDLLTLAKVADQAHSWIHDQKQNAPGEKEVTSELE